MVAKIEIDFLKEREHMDKVEKKQAVFYGAGGFAIQNIEAWKGKWDPVCFADADESKWGEFIGGIIICSLDEALNRYPDKDVVITVNSHFEEVYDYLIDQGISKRKLSFVIPREKRMGCHLLGTLVQFDGGKEIRTCCYEHAYKQVIREDLGAEINKFLEHTREINIGLKNGTGTTCDGCALLSEGWWETEPKVNSVSLASGFKHDVCNCRCSYCDARLFLDNANKDEHLTVLEACEYFAGDDRFDDIHIALNDGEFVINKFRKEVLAICEKKHWDIILYTNAIQLSDELLKYMKKNNNSHIICSIDAGTQSTFKAIKGVDAFDKVVSNLSKYKEFGHIALKYIFVKGINDNLTDVNAFIDIADRLADEVIISRDLYQKEEGFDSNERDIYKKIVNELLYKRHIPVSVTEDCMPDSEVEWLRMLFQGDV